MSTRGCLPNGYHLYDRFDLSQLRGRVSAALSVAALGCGLLALVLALLARDAWHGGESADTEGPLAFLIIVLSIVGVLALHEAIHGGFARLFGARPQFGFKPLTKFGPVFCASFVGSFLPRRQYAVVGLGPMVVLTAPVLLLGIFLRWDMAGVPLLLAMAGNFAASVGDTVMMYRVAGYPDAACFEDTGDGFRVYLPKSSIR